jgi:phosphoglycerate kinase
MNHALRSVEDLSKEEVKNKDILVRVSFDAFNKEGYIQDSLRIEASEKTIRLLKEKGARRIILLSYTGRPKKYDPLLSLRSAADFLYGMFREEVHFMPAVGRLGTFIKNPAEYVLFVKNRIKDLGNGSIIVLDNLRFWAGENKGNDPEGQEFAKVIASLGEIYVQDGFAQAHRINNATVGEITKHVKIKVIGCEFKSEIEYLEGVYRNLMKKERKPFIFVIGGKKLETKPGIVSKLDVVNKLMKSMKKCDKVLIGGAMSYPFIIAKKYEKKLLSGEKISWDEIRGVVGKSFIEKDEINDHIILSHKTFMKGKENGVEIKLPIDHTVTNSKLDYVNNIGKEMSAGDIGPKTMEEWKGYLSDADTIILAGPLGWYENALFSEGSRSITKAIANATKSGTITIAAGGDTSAMVKRFGHQNDFSLVSIGGGATLEFLMKGSLPVMDLLDKKGD